MDLKRFLFLNSRITIYSLGNYFRYSCGSFLIWHKTIFGPVRASIIYSKV